MINHSYFYIIVPFRVTNEQFFKVRHYRHILTVGNMLYPMNCDTGNICNTQMFRLLLLIRRIDTNLRQTYKTLLGHKQRRQTPKMKVVSFCLL